MTAPTGAHQLRERGQIITSRSARQCWLCKHSGAGRLPPPASPALHANSCAMVPNNDHLGSDTYGRTAPKMPDARKGCRGAAQLSLWKRTELHGSISSQSYYSCHLPSRTYVTAAVQLKHRVLLCILVASSQVQIAQSPTNCMIQMPNPWYLGLL